jgi:hypothetical protein
VRAATARAGSRADPRAARRIAALGLAVALTACGAPAAAPPPAISAVAPAASALTPATVAAPVPPPAAPPAPNAAATAAVPPPATEPSAPPQPDAEPAPVALAALRAELDPRRLVGLNEGELARVLGEPRLRRKEPPAEVWQYASADCVLHLFLYAGRDRAGLRVRHVEVRGRDRAARSERECFASVLDARGARQG